MNPPPADWKDDAALWKALGQMPRARPPSNFASEIRRKRDAEARELSRSAFRHAAIFLRDWLTLPRFTPRWAVAAAAATVCFTLGLALQPAGSSVRSETEILTQNLELIQNLDVIEHLDEL
ncbi:MAG: hypothetical protein IT578_07920 [Verrucomicrobiae bacterium]|nr:hypothetical protein [Verrucomicrobiae bacterium]